MSQENTGTSLFTIVFLSNIRDFRNQFWIGCLIGESNIYKSPVSIFVQFAYSEIISYDFLMTGCPMIDEIDE